MVEAPADPPPSSRSRWLRWTILVLLLLILVGLRLLHLDEWLWDFLKNNRDDLQHRVDENFALALFLYFLLYVVATGLSLPAASILTLAGGALFGVVWGSATVSFASTAGATLAFLTSRYLLRDYVRQRFGARLAPIERGVEKDGAWYLLTLRLIPVVPFFLINLGMGLTPIRTRTYWWVSQLGMLPATVIYVNVGTRLGELQSPKGLLDWQVLLSLSLLALVPLALRLLIGRLQKRSGKP
jgi:uncharacterized membrane protein YdjX (TVP38/TMEM64 family)